MASSWRKGEERRKKIHAMLSGHVAHCLQHTVLVRIIIHILWHIYFTNPFNSFYILLYLFDSPVRQGGAYSFHIFNKYLQFISLTTSKGHFNSHRCTTHQLDRQSGSWQTEVLEEPEEKTSKIQSPSCY